jgi:hypothetical protein
MIKNKNDNFENEKKMFFTCDFFVRHCDLSEQFGATSADLEAATESKTSFRPAPLFKTIQSCSWKASRLYANTGWRASKTI